MRWFFLFGMTLAGLVGCDGPPCEAYWQPMCERCTADPLACDAAKAYSEGALRDEGACQTAASRFTTLSALPGEPDMLCRLPADSAPPDPQLLGVAFRCGRRLTLQIDMRQIEVGGDTFELVRLSDRAFHVKTTPSTQTQCTYRVANNELHVDCASAVGALGADPTTCSPRPIRRGKRR